MRKWVALDLPLLQETLESKAPATPWALDAAGCPPWLVSWLHNAWWAVYRDQKLDTANMIRDNWITEQGLCKAYDTLAEAFASEKDGLLKPTHKRE